MSLKCIIPLQLLQLLQQSDLGNSMIHLTQYYFIDYRASRLPLDTDSMGYWTCKLIYWISVILSVWRG